jgi:uncharacterized protein (DUF58 family)
VDTYQRGVSSLFVTSIVLFLVGLCLLAALINTSLHLTILCLLVFAIVAGFKLWTRSGASDLQFDLSLDRSRLFPGEPLRLTLSAANKGFLPLSFEAQCPISGGLRPLSDDGPLRAENTLLWFQSILMDWELEASRRGIHAIGPATMAAGDLLGFFVAQTRWKEEFEVIVYPRLVPLRPLPLPKRDFFGVPGGESPVDDPVYILGTVDYHHGRPARHIHWKASARHNRLQQKVFEPTEQEKIMLVVDVGGFDQTHEAAFEETLEVVASLTARFDEQGSAVGFLTNAVVPGGPPFISVTRNPFQVGSILETLARMEMRRGTAMADLLRRTPVIPWGTTCIYFALESTGETDRGRAVFSRRRTPVVFMEYQTTRRLREEHRSGHRVERRLSVEEVDGVALP